MSGDRSLDEFVSGGDESSADVDGDTGDESSAEVDDDSGDESATEVDGDAGDAVGSDTEESSETVTPATSTYAWSPSGTPCDACGASVERRWRDEGDLVCGDCKSW